MNALPTMLLRPQNSLGRILPVEVMIWCAFSRICISPVCVCSSLPLIKIMSKVRVSNIFSFFSPRKVTYSFCAWLTRYEYLYSPINVQSYTSVLLIVVLIAYLLPHLMVLS